MGVRIGFSSDLVSEILIVSVCDFLRNDLIMVLGQFSDPCENDFLIGCF